MMASNDAPILKWLYKGHTIWLFFGPDHGGERGASLYSLIGTCKLNGVDPERNLHHVLDVIADWPVNRVGDLLPWRVTLPVWPASLRQYGSHCTLTGNTGLIFLYQLWFEGIVTIARSTQFQWTVACDNGLYGITVAGVSSRFGLIFLIPKMVCHFCIESSFNAEDWLRSSGVFVQFVSQSL